MPAVHALTLISLLPAGPVGPGPVGPGPVGPGQAEQHTPPGDPAAGYRFLRTAPLLPPDFDRDTLLGTAFRWPADLRDRARGADDEEKLALAFSRYGLVTPPAGDPVGGAVLNYVETPAGWVMNCFACHGGKVAGETIPGLPNSHYGLQTLTEDVRAAKLWAGKPLSHQDVASVSVPLGGSHGTTNAVVFGVLLDALRNPDMSVDMTRSPGKLVHHDVDPPPWWHAKKKSRLYIDGFSPKNHRVLMQFMLLPENGKDVVLGWEDDFRDVLAYIESVEAPGYPFDINKDLAARGAAVFNDNCAECHGTYGDDPAAETYPELTVPIDVIGTDRVRLDALTVAHREHLKTTWMSDYGNDPVVTDPGGYVAPPLDGVWATAPYFHNGSVPTLEGVLHPDTRPAVWRRSEDGYDQTRVGLEVTRLADVPAPARGTAEARFYFDTRLRGTGKTNTGHTFGDHLNIEDTAALLEYLKTL